MRTALERDLRARLARQDAFFASNEPGFLVFATYRGMWTDVPGMIEDWPGVGSPEFIFARSTEMGRQKWREVVGIAEKKLPVGDDAVLSPAIDWGTGATASLVTGAEPIFQPMTSYSLGHVVENPGDIDALRLDLDNPWIAADVDYWRGFFDLCDGPVPVTGHNYRSPLDLANDLRGNELFTDMYDRPEDVERLANWCAESTIAVDRHIRQRVPALRDHPSGAWGVARSAGGMLFLNGDPVDLISVEMGERFNRPTVERIADYASGVYFHHHSIGIDRAVSIGAIGGLAVQEIIQDPNGPRICDRIDDALVAASLSVPIDLAPNVAAWDNVDELLDRMAAGRFILRVDAETIEEAREWVRKIRAVHG